MYFIEEFRLAFCLKILEVLRVTYLWAPTMATHRAHDPMESKWTPTPTHTSVTPFALASAHFTLRLQIVTISSPFTLNSSVSSPPPHPLIHWGDVDPGRNRWGVVSSPHWHHAAIKTIQLGIPSVLTSTLNTTFGNLCNDAWHSTSFNQSSFDKQPNPVLNPQCIYALRRRPKKNRW